MDIVYSTQLYTCVSHGTFARGRVTTPAREKIGREVEPSIYHHPWRVGHQALDPERSHSPTNSPPPPSSLTLKSLSHQEEGRRRIYDAATFFARSRCIPYKSMEGKLCGGREEAGLGPRGPARKATRVPPPSSALILYVRPPRRPPSSFSLISLPSPGLILASPPLLPNIFTTRVRRRGVS